MPRTSDTPQPPQEQRDLFLPGWWARPQVPSGVTCSGWLAASLVLISGSVTAQEALRNSLAGEAAASGRHQQEQPGAYTVKSGDFRLLVSPSLELEGNDNVNASKTNAEADFILRPLLQLDASYPISQYNLLNLSVGVGYDKYVEHNELSTWRLQSGTQLSFDIYVGDFWINLHDRASYVQDSTQEAAIAGSAQYGTIDNTAGLSGVWDLEDVSLTLGYDHRIVVSGTGQFQSQDNSSDSILGRAGFKLHPRFTAGLEGTASITTYDQMVLNNNTGYSVGLFGDWQAGDYFNVQPRAGYALYQFQQTSQFIQTSDLSSWYFDVPLTHQVNNVVSYTIDAGHELRLGIQSDAIEDTYFRPSVTLNMIKDVSCQLSFRYEHGKQGLGNVTGNLVETYDWIGGGLDLSYALMKKLTLGLNYRITYRTSDIASRGYLQNVLGLRLTYYFR